MSRWRAECLALHSWYPQQYSLMPVEVAPQQSTEMHSYESRARQSLFLPDLPLQHADPSAAV